MDTLLRILTEAAAQADRAELREALEQIERQQSAEAAYHENVMVFLLVMFVCLLIALIGLTWEQWKLSRKVAMLEAARNVEESEVQHV